MNFVLKVLLKCGSRFSTSFRSYALPNVFSSNASATAVYCLFLFVVSNLAWLMSPYSFVFDRGQTIGIWGFGGKRGVRVGVRSIAQQVEIRSERRIDERFIDSSEVSLRFISFIWEVLRFIIAMFATVKHWILNARALLASLGNQISSEDV